ncbi:MAG: LapD/MoxY N-terminal periplasmic domain-containing protein, partial [Burkholderiales bacterium]
MTLGRLLFAGVSAIFALVLVGVEAIYVRNAQHYLQQQLEAHAQETATSLALTLGAMLTEPDAALAATVVNPVFDRGQFESIRLVSPEGRLVTERRLARRDYDTPAWFRGLFPIARPHGEALVSSGWKQLGRVEVTLHPAFAYRQLWSVAGETAALLLALYAMALLATRWVLRAILKPLARVERAAIAISNREFVELPQESRTTELRRVVAAMNALSAKVREAIAQESARMQRYLREAYQDHVSGRLNYGGFVQRAKTLVHGENEVAAGTLALVALRGVEEINRARGREVGDALLRALGEVLAREFEGRVPLVGRQDGAAFYAFVPELRGEDAARWMRGVMAEVRASHGLAAAGVVCFSETRPALDELEQWADSALGQALQSGSDMVLLDFDPREGRARPIAEWRATIEEALAAHRIAVVAQDVRALPGER